MIVQKPTPHPPPPNENSNTESAEERSKTPPPKPKSKSNYDAAWRKRISEAAFDIDDDNKDTDRPIVPLSYGVKLKSSLCWKSAHLESLKLTSDIHKFSRKSNHFLTL